MSTPLLIVSTATDVVVYLELAATGQPATGLTFSDVTAGIKKEGASSFTSFVLSGGNFTSLGNGFYKINLTSSDTNTLGSLYLSFQGATIKNALIVARVATAASAVAPPTPTPGLTPQITSIFGYILDQMGNPKEDVVVSVRTVAMPTVLHPVDQGLVLTSEFLTTTTDATGFFTVSLITGTTVEFVIPDANYRRTILVPGNTTNLFDIP